MFKRVEGHVPQEREPSFNPSVGILGVQAACSECGLPFYSLVSIPRSGFWVFKRPARPAATAATPRFNPSVGILGVQAALKDCNVGKKPLFQSLGRDSGCSSLISGIASMRKSE